jgi:NADH-quinone oxidoreductase subunit L
LTDPRIIATLVPALPLLGFLLVVAFTKRFKLLSALVSIACIAGSLALSVLLFLHVWRNPAAVEAAVPWLTLGTWNIEAGVLVNPLTAVMFLVVTGVSFLVQVYSLGYMKGDEGISRFFAFLSLFSFSMLGLTVANGFILLYIFWELVGLSSYLLIGFWYHKPEAAEAAKKAFITTRFGDFGFLVGIILLCTLAHTFSFAGTGQFVASGAIAPGMLTLVVLLLFAGAVGKSGQFPLHVWLPDAMEGPTPVSALIHAATMVAAGVFMVARLFGIFSASADAMTVVSVIGGFTALFAATIALAQYDIKKILAYSTVSQLGLMMLAMGVGSPASGSFHLVTHAAFKALLFLCAGSVIHAVGVNDIRQMGGLFRKMPLTAVSFLVAGLAIAGIFPFAGFWSKDEILLAAWTGGHKVLFAMAAATSFLTAFYIFRIFFVVFTGKERVGSHAHESPPVMTIPLIILAILSAVVGLTGMAGSEHGLLAFLGAPAGEEQGGHSVAIASTVIAVTGILLSFLVFGARIVDPEKIRKKAGWVHTLLHNKYYIDEFYMVTIRAFLFLLSRIFVWIDHHVVDGAVNGVAWLTRKSGDGLRLTISGRIQTYALMVFGGLIVVLLLFFVFHPSALGPAVGGG